MELSAIVTALHDFDVRHLAGPTSGVAHSVALVEDVDGIDERLFGSIVILTASTSSQLDDYQLDVALRRAGESGVAAVVLPGWSALARSGDHVADRSAVAVLGSQATKDLAHLVIATERALRPGADAQLARIVRLLDVIDEAAEAGAETVITEASRVLAHDLEIVEQGDETEPHASLEPGATGDVVVGARLAAEAVARIRRRERRNEELLLRSGTQLLDELLTQSLDRANIAAAKASPQQFRVDGWHRVANLELVSEEGDQLDREARLDALALVLGRALPARHWLSGVVHGRLVIVHTEVIRASTDPHASVPQFESLIEHLTAASPELSSWVGLGGAHQGLTGLRSSAAEARSAILTARANQRPDKLTLFDASGIRRILTEWLASDTARTSVVQLLGGLDTLGPERATEMVRTLQVYLDERGSFAKAGRRLNLHANAVAYRVRQASALIDTDLKDPEERLALQIACRASLMFPPQ